MPPSTRPDVPWPRIPRSAMARVMLPRTATDAIPTVCRLGVVCRGVWLGLARRSGWRRWLRRVSGGARARPIVRHHRRLRRRFAHHELLRAGTDLRFADNRADALHDARGAVRPDLSGVWLRRAAAARRRWLTCAIPSHRGCHLRPGQVHDFRPRVRSNRARRERPVSAARTTAACSRPAPRRAPGAPIATTPHSRCVKAARPATRTGCSARQRTSRATRSSERNGRGEVSA